MFAEALVSRNIAGHARFALKDILFANSLMNLQNLLIVHHTDCGATHFTNEKIQGVLKNKFPGKEAEIDEIDFGAIEGGEYVLSLLSCCD